MKAPDRKTVVIGTICTLAFGFLLFLCYDFVLDDAYIIYRYAQNLAHGHGVVWNVGEDPVEGYTSFAWVVLNAFAILLGLNPVLFSKTVSVLAVLLIIWDIARVTKKMNWGLAFIFAGSIALSPPFAFLTIQGTETVFTAFILYVLARLSFEIAGGPARMSYCWFWWVVAFIGGLTRPDTLVFSFGIFVGLTAYLTADKNWKLLRGFLLPCPVFVMFGLIYMVWRISYFGYFFPNTFYIKFAGTAGKISPWGVNDVKVFLTRYLSPYFLIISFLAGKYFDKKRIIYILPVVLGAIFFGLYLFFINPIQGFFWRFIFPVYPATLYAVVYYFAKLEYKRLFIARWWVSLILVLVFAGWTLRFTPSVLFAKENVTQYDRVAMGKELAGIPGTMFTSESGALPYYSGWKTIDMLGLNSEEIAHNGLSTEFLISVNPDLIMILDSPGKFSPDDTEISIIKHYMVDYGFVTVAVVHRSFDHYHSYFVREDSRYFSVIVDRLSDVDSLEYADMGKRLFGEEIPVFEKREVRTD
ncbi:MAG: hypothetical protein JSW52_08000 [Candidatus Coatesbacteria bacterium]|nr:MAG: hypothetical protein JSW52_08000 [Candidatus Coatesbacteria bacterium]